MGFEQAWLSYQKRETCGVVKNIDRIYASLQNPVIRSGAEELQAAFAGIIGNEPVLYADSEYEPGEGRIRLLVKEGLKAEGYHLLEEKGEIIVEAPDANGILYGVFELIRHLQLGKNLDGKDITKEPVMPLRMLNHWDNMDGSIERGYSGNSFFFEDNQILVNDRIVTYARLLASAGINATVINNVNVKDSATWLITDRYLERVKQMVELFAGYGIRLFLSLNFAAPFDLGGPKSADPLDEAVIGWWKEKIARIYDRIPGLGGFLVKADSEGRPGPFTYGRTQADGANMLADLVEPYGGIIIWRCFVYNCQQDWRDYKTDRARAAYDSFMPLDGEYHENVILQIKNGPMDFQIREPVSPLLGGLKRTNQMLEVQVAQEYTGHQIDVCYLIPMFKEILEFRTYCSDHDDTVADIISGRTMNNRNAGIAAVCNTGNDANWTGSDLAAANFYGFGRLAYDMGLSAEEIAEEWIRMTLSNDQEVVEKVKTILLGSRVTYEKYTSPLGIGWMVTPAVHYGPSIDGYEYSCWGTYHRADFEGIGVDRSHRGTGYAQQYYESNASMYDSPESCPEELLLFFHHVPYTYRLKTGKTVIQHIYDTHFEGVEEVESMISSWKSLKGKIETEVFDMVLERFGRQLSNAREWRDQVNTYFYRKSGIMDEKRRKIW